MSRKLRVWAKGTFATGTASTGFIWCDPQLGINNNVDSVLFSLNTYAGTTFALFGVVGVAAAQTNSDYASTQIAVNDITYRVVSSGLRIRYIGTELNRGGQIVACSDSNHNSLLNRSLTDLDQEINSKRFPVTREWVTVIMRPVRDADDDFGVNPTLIPTTTSLSWYNGIIVESPGDPITFEWEYYSVYEAQGQNVRGQTPSHVDPVGYGAVNMMTNFTKHLDPYQGHPQKKEKSAVEDTVKLLGSTMSKAEPFAKAAVDLFSENYLGAAIDFGEGIFGLFD